MAASDPHPAHRHDHAHGHGHGHAHTHAHGHGHSHAPASFGGAFAIGIALNIAFVLIEGAVGAATGSMALLADAGHNLSDVLGLGVAWGGATLARRPPNRRFTYGLRGSTILAALFNALFLLVATGAIALEAIERIGRPHAVPGDTIMLVAAIGILVNGTTAWLFARGRHGDINTRGAFLHMAADTAVSAGVVLAGLLIRLTGAEWLDSAVSLAIVAVILWSTWGLLREAVTMSLDAVPAGIDPDRVERALAAVPGIDRLHHLHIWPMSTTETALTAHLVVDPAADRRQLLAEARHCLHDEFHITHATFEIDEAAGDAPAPCR